MVLVRIQSPQLFTILEMELGRKRSTRLINGRSLVRSQSSQLLGPHVPWGRDALALHLWWVRFPLGPLFSTTKPMRTGERFRRRRKTYGSIPTGSKFFTINIFSRSSSTEEQQSDLLKAASSTLASSTFLLFLRCNSVG